GGGSMSSKVSLHARIPSRSKTPACRRTPGRDGSEAVIETDGEVAPAQVVLAEVIRRTDARVGGIERRSAVAQVLHLGVQAQVLEPGVAHIQVQLAVAGHIVLQRTGGAAGTLLVA